MKRIFGTNRRGLFPKGQGSSLEYAFFNFVEDTGDNRPGLKGLFSDGQVLISDR